MPANSSWRLAAALAAGIIAVTGLSGASYFRTVPSGPHRAAMALPPLLDGDLVFRRGHDLVSRLVLTQSNASKFSHVGIVVLERGASYVVHALPAEGHDVGGVRMEALPVFAAPANAAEFAIFRIATLTAQERARIRHFAISVLGRPFDDQFRLSDDSRLYCTETVLDAFASAGHVLVPKGAGVLAPTMTEPAVPPDLLIQHAGASLQQVYFANLEQ